MELASLGAFREPQDLETTPFDVSDTDNVKEHRDFKRGIVNGRLLVQLNFTDKQYDALARLYATLLRRFPKLKLAYPIEESSADEKKAFATALDGDVGVSRDAYPDVDTDKLTDARRRDFAGALGHFHVQSNKVDPGPAFDWKRLIAETRAALAANGADAA